MPVATEAPAQRQGAGLTRWTPPGVPVACIANSPYAFTGSTPVSAMNLPRVCDVLIRTPAVSTLGEGPVGLRLPATPAGGRGTD
jgi:hypothetical protein